MSRALLDHVVASSMKKVPEIKPGATVRVHQKIKEGEKERIQIFKGLVIRVNSGTKVDKSFTVRKVVEGVGVEKIFPFHSPMIERIEIIKRGKVRRAKLFYMRDLEGKATRLRESDVAAAMADETPAEAPAEAPAAAEVPVDVETPVQSETTEEKQA